MTNSPARPPAASHQELIPRFRMADAVTLDLIYRDGRVESRWLGLHPREFDLFWRLAEEPGVCVTKRDLLRDVWRLEFEPATNSLAVHIARLRGKLRHFGLAHIIATHAQGGYFLDIAAEASELTLKPATKP